VPKRSVLAGDPYYCQCLKTARLVAESLELSSDRWAVSFQSRLGRAEWLQPYTVEQLREWARAGVRRVDVICPGFAADCLETLEEIALRYREEFEKAGGAALRYVPALNARADHVAFLAGLIARNLQGWPEPHKSQSGASAAESARRAREMGAVH
jgi:ferrochelatase